MSCMQALADVTDLFLLSRRSVLLTFFMMDFLLFGFVPTQTYYLRDFGAADFAIVFLIHISFFKIANLVNIYKVIINC